MMDFNPFVRIKEKPRIAKTIPASLKPFSPSFADDVLFPAGYILDWDFVDGNLVMVYSEGTKVLHRGMTKKSAWELVKKEAVRYA